MIPSKIGFNVDDPELVSNWDEVSLWCARFGLVMLDNLPVRAGIRGLDLACGSGFPVLELAKLFGASSSFVAVDTWTAALDRARGKARIQDVRNVEFVEADVRALPFADGSFDMATANLALNNFDGHERFLSEVSRVLVPGGLFATTSNITGTFSEFYRALESVLLDVGAHGDLQRLRVQEQHRMSRSEIEALCLSAGLQPSKVLVQDLVFRFADSSALFNYYLCRIGFWEGWLSIVQEADPEQVFARVARVLDAGGEVRMTVPCLYLEAIKS